MAGTGTVRSGVGPEITDVAIPVADGEGAAVPWIAYDLGIAESVPPETGTPADETPEVPKAPEEGEPVASGLTAPGRLSNLPLSRQPSRTSRRRATIQNTHRPSGSAADGANQRPAGRSELTRPLGGGRAGPGTRPS